MVQPVKNLIQRHLAVPREHWIISSEDLRDMWLDFPETQELFEDLLEENDPLAYDKCIARALIWMNGKQPKTYFNAANFPDEGLLIDRSFVEVLKVAERYHAANFSTGSAGGTSTPINERYVSLGGLRRELEANCEARLRELKIFINNEGFYGTIDDYGARGEYGAYGYPFP